MPVLVLIEDDAAIRTALVRALSRRGHAVYAAPTALAGLEMVTSRSPDVVVLDLGLPDVDGVDVCRAILATARDDEAEMVRVLDLGADDYVVTPVSAEQLEARLRAVLRRGRPADPWARIGSVPAPVWTATVTPTPASARESSSIAST